MSRGCGAIATRKDVRQGKHLATDQLPNLAVYLCCARVGGADTGTPGRMATRVSQVPEMRFSPAHNFELSSKQVQQHAHFLIYTYIFYSQRQKTGIPIFDRNNSPAIHTFHTWTRE